MLYIYIYGVNKSYKKLQKDPDSWIKYKSGSTKSKYHMTICIHVSTAGKYFLLYISLYVTVPFCPASASAYNPIPRSKGLDHAAWRQVAMWERAMLQVHDLANSHRFVSWCSTNHLQFCKLYSCFLKHHIRCTLSSTHISVKVNWRIHTEFIKHHHEFISKMMMKIPLIHMSSDWEKLLSLKMVILIYTFRSIWTKKNLETSTTQLFWIWTI